jgi:hypothetical protein
LQIIHPDGRTEKFEELIFVSNTKNYQKNLVTLLRAFEYLGSQGYELQSDSRNEKDLLDINNQFLFKRRISNDVSKNKNIDE